MRIFNIPYRLLLFAVMTAWILGGCIWITFHSLPILEELEARGLPAEAEVIWVGEPYIVLGRGNHSRYGWRQDAIYGYRTQTGAWIADEKTYVKQNAPHVGLTFPVTYLPDRPHVHDSGYGNGYAGIGMIYALLIMAAVCAGMLGYFCWRLPPGWAGPRLWPVFKVSDDPV